MKRNQRIQTYRGMVDQLDRKLVSLLNRRMEVCQRIGELKIKKGMPLKDSEREAAVITRMHESNHGPLGRSALVYILRGIIRESRRVQRNARAMSGGKVKK